jgi:hypothetical protein
MFGGCHDERLGHFSRATLEHEIGREDGVFVGMSSHFRQPFQMRAPFSSVDH